MEKMETNRTVIDTDILIDFLRNKKEAVALIVQLEEKKTLLCTTTINAFELCYGAYKSKNTSQNLQATKNLLGRLVVFPLNYRSAQKAGEIYSQLESEGYPVGVKDTLIAAIALTRKSAVATRNIEHFKKIKDLNLVTI